MRSIWETCFNCLKDAMWCIDYLIKLLCFIEIIEIDVFFTAYLMKLLGFIERIEVDVFFYSYANKAVRLYCNHSNWCVFLQLQFTVEISYFEIYNEKIHDLLAASKKKENKRVQVMVENLRCIPYFHVTMLWQSCFYCWLTTFIASGGQMPKTTLRLASNSTRDGISHAPSSTHNPATSPCSNKGINKIK